MNHSNTRAAKLSRRTVIRGAYGIFYNSNLGWEWSTGRGNWPYSISDNVTGVNIPGVAPTRADQQFGSFDSSKVKPTAQHTIARDLTMPYMQNWNLGVEHQLTQSLLLEINYRLSTQPESGSRMSLFWVGIDTATPYPCGNPVRYRGHHVAQSDRFPRAGRDGPAGGAAPTGA